MLQLFRLSFVYNLKAHISNLPNLIAGTLGMVMNNVIFLIGMWGMLFVGKPEHQSLLYYYLALNTLVMLAWGAINFFFGGWIDLGDLIVNGSFESKLATPRHPLFLVATHSLHPSALGDFLMGIIGIILLFALDLPGMAIRTLVASLIAFIALFSLYIFSGSLAFFFPRGNMISLLIREMTISLSCYPIGKIFPGGLGRLLLLMTPAASISLLPMEWIETSGLKECFYSLLAVLLTLFISLRVYSIGVKRYQTINYIGLQN